MEDRNQLSRSFFVFAVTSAIAVLLGYCVATPLALRSVAVIGLVLFGLSLPILMRHHRLILLLSFNSSLVIFFLPKALPLWVMTSFMSLGFSILERATAGRRHYQHVPSIAIPLLIFAVLMVGISKFSGGIGFQALGSDVGGGKRYLFLMAAIASYFAFACFQPEPKQAKRMLILYFAVGILAITTHIIYAMGPPFYFLFNFFPPEMTSLGELEFGGPGSLGMVRYGGLSQAAVALCMMMQLSFGIRGLLDFSRPWRFGFYLFLVVLSLFGGFRSILAFIVLAFVVQFIFEGLTFTRYSIGIVAAGVLSLMLVLPFAGLLPKSFQRALCVIPFADVDPAVRVNAEDSTEWRINMWKMVLPEVRAHLWVGKGYAINPMDLHLANESVRRGFMQTFEPAMLAGEYHSGPLSILIPFGIPGFILMIWFVAGIWLYLWRAVKHGRKELRPVNIFLISYITSKALFFILVYGSFSQDLQVFAGLGGLAVAMNGGLGRNRKEDEVQDETEVALTETREEMAVPH